MVIKMRLWISFKMWISIALLLLSITCGENVGNIFTLWVSYGVGKSVGNYFIVIIKIITILILCFA